MNTEQQSKYLINAISNIKEVSPVLLIGGAASLFKKLNKTHSIIVVNNTQQVRDFVSEYMGMSYTQPVIISDVGQLQYDAAFILLKLIEESKFPIILLSSRDRISRILLSRIKTIIKFPIDANTGSNLLSPKEATEMLASTQGSSEGEVKMSKNEMDKFYAEESPMLYHVTKNTPYTHNRDMLIEMMGVKS